METPITSRTYLEVRGGSMPIPSREAGCGNTMGWGALTPAVWGAIADPGGVYALPTLTSARGPDRGGWPAPAEFAIWTAVLEIILYSLGWSEPAKGIDRWRTEGYLTDDRRFDVLARLLGENVEANVADLLNYLCFEAGVKFHGLLAPVQTDIRPPRWLIDLRASDPTGFTLLADELHLTTHVLEPAPAHISGAVHPDRTPSSFATWTDDNGRGRGVFTCDAWSGWYGALERALLGLPEGPGGRSWRVDAFCKPVGWLGEFRLSRETHLPFTGRHRYHQWGNP